MIVNFIRTVYYFNSAIIIALLGWKEKYKELYYSGVYFNKKTFRFPEEFNSDHLITLRIYKRILLSLLNRENPFINFNRDTKEAIFDSSLDSAELRLTYIESITKVKSDLFIAKNNLLYYRDFWQALLIFSLLIMTLLPVFFVSFFSKTKIKYPLLIMELVECFNLQLVLRKHGIKKLHYFCIFERDANLCAYILMKTKVYINKIPSEVPLVFANKVVVADQLSFCFAYQQEEFRFYRETMFVNKTEQWVPEQFFKTPPRLLAPNQNGVKSIYDIGFFSSGNWLRHALGHPDLGRNDKENEEALLKVLMDYTASNNLSLCIFLHPLEKRMENARLLNAYYKGILSCPHIHIAERKKLSIDGFDEINLGIGQYSTLMFERIVLGFKTILAPWGYPEFPISQSALKNCCAEDENDLMAKLNLNLGYTNTEFYINNNLNNYVFNPLYKCT